eukprot:2356614-Rhodomonas_salina.8
MASESIVHGLADTLIPCEPHLYDTLQRLSMVAPGANVSVAINCVTDHNESSTKGWLCKIPAAAPASTIAVQPNLFEGITVVETAATETQILDLLKNKDKTVQAMSRIAEQFHPSVVKDRISWDACHPERSIPLQNHSAWNVHISNDSIAKYTCVEHDQHANTQEVRFVHDAPLDLVPDNSVPNYVDSAKWTPELPPGAFIGLYHQWYSTFDGCRELKLFFVCQSSCQKAGLEIKQLVNDLPVSCTAQQLAVSEEMWWLSNVNMRNRNRLIYEFAKELNIEIPVIEDCHSFQEAYLMAQPTTHNFLHSVCMLSDTVVGVMNECIPTQHVSNGVVCRLAPSEGIWVFNGTQRHNISRFGGPFGSSDTVFPLTTVQLDPYTLMVAKQLGYIIQQASTVKPGFLYQSLHANTVHNNSDSDTASVGSANDGSGDEAQSDSTMNNNLAADFPGLHLNDLDAVEINNIARQAWIKAKKQQVRHHARNASNAVHLPMQCPTQMFANTAHHSFISFEDSVVWDRLKSSGWDPRYGVLKLIPLAVYTM